VRGGYRARLIGKTAEYSLKKRLEKAGWSVMRAPASGARSSEAVPDIVALKAGRILMFEVKLRDKPRSIYIEEHKYTGIMNYARRAGAQVYLAVKVRGEDDFRVLPWSEAERVELRNGVWYVFYKEKLDRAKTLTQLLSELGA